MNVTVVTRVDVDLDGSPTDGEPIRYWTKGPDGRTEEISEDDFHFIYQHSPITNKSSSLSKIVSALRAYGVRGSQDI
jgi:hypothetical protein